MIRILALLSVVFAAQTVFAAPKAPQAPKVYPGPKAPVIPTGLSCIAEDRSVHDADKPILITGIGAKDDKDTEINMDGRFQGMDSNANNTDMNFNNGCDSSYTFLFITDDLDLLGRGRLNKIHGLLQYFNADSAGGVSWDESDKPKPSSPVTCQIYTGKQPE